MRLNDKQLADVLSAADDIKQTFGAGIVILLGGELQERRAAELLSPSAPDALNPLNSNDQLLGWLIARVNGKEPMPDGKVLALFHALQKQGYFQTVTWVDRKALETVVHALACTDHPHLIRELQVTRNLPVAEGEPLNPINQLIRDARNAPAQPD